MRSLTKWQWGVALGYDGFAFQATASNIASSESRGLVPIEFAVIGTDSREHDFRRKFCH
jgi:hypothetical protein